MGPITNIEGLEGVKAVQVSKDPMNIVSLQRKGAGVLNSVKWRNNETRKYLENW